MAGGADPRHRPGKPDKPGRDDPALSEIRSGRPKSCHSGRFPWLLGLVDEAETDRPTCPNILPEKRPP